VFLQVPSGFWVSVLKCGTGMKHPPVVEASQFSRSQAMVESVLRGKGAALNNCLEPPVCSIVWLYVLERNLEDTLKGGTPGHCHNLSVCVQLDVRSLGH